jgi:VWFA-related protein
MRRVAFVLCLAAIPALALAQQPPVTERIEVSVTNVDVAVTGPDGQPLRGLTRDDFEIFEDGRRQPITNFYVVEKDVPRSSVATPSSMAVPAPVASTSQPRFRRKVLVLVDVFGTTKHYRAVALNNLEKMIDDSFQTGEYDWSIGILSRGVTLVLPLTSDKAAVHNAFDRMINVGERHERLFSADVVAPTGVPNVESAPGELSVEQRIDTAMSFDERDRILRAGFTTRAIIDAVRGFASTPGKKIVLLVTGDIGLNDLPLSIDNGGMILPRAPDPELARRIAELRDSMVREANASGVSIYVLNPEPLRPQDPRGGMSANPGDAQMTDTAAIFWLSKDTGGRMVGGNDTARALREFDTASSNYYSLGYRSPHADDGKEHRIQVRLTNGKHGKLDYRSSYASSPSEAQLERAMKSPVAAALLPTALPVALVTGAHQADKRGVSVPISVRVPFSSLQFLPADKGTAAHVRVYVSVFDDIGKNLFTGNFPMTLRFPNGVVDPHGTMVYKNAVVLTKGTKNQILTAVRDETTDVIGFASAWVQTAQ